MRDTCGYVARHPPGCKSSFEIRLLERWRDRTGEPLLIRQQAAGLTSPASRKPRYAFDPHFVSKETTLHDRHR